MDVKNLVMAVIALSLGAVMIAGALLPAVGSAVVDEKVIINNGSVAYRASTEESADFVGSTGTPTYTMGENTITMVQNGSSQIITSSNFVLTSLPNYVLRVNYIDINGVLVHELNVTDVSISIDNDNVEGTYTTAQGDAITIDIPINWGFWITTDTNAENVFYASYANSVICVNNLNQIYASNYVTTTGDFFEISDSVLKVNGVVNDTLMFNPPKVEGYTDFYRFTFTENSEELSFIVDNGGTDYTVHPYFIIVPKSIYVTPETNAAVVAMFESIPLIVVAGLVMAGVYVFITRK